jgi:hypothetical protein
MTLGDSVTRSYGRRFRYTQGTTATGVTATTLCQCVSRNRGAPERERGDDNCYLVQHKPFHWTAFLFDLTSPIDPAQVRGVSIVASRI